MSTAQQNASAPDAGASTSKNLRIALAGNPNCGKTTVFNGYTGARQHVGNYPGVTVERKEGDVMVGDTRVTLVDLPGTYSLTAYSMEEIVARRELSSNNIQAVIDVAEASALERNLLLTVQMLEMGMPVVLGCNMMDEARAGGITIDMPRLSQALGIPVFPMTARSGDGLKEVMDAAVRQAREGLREPLRLSYGTDIDHALKEMEEKIASAKLLAGRYHPYYVALKLLERDGDMMAEAGAADAVVSGELRHICDRVARHVRETLNTGMESVITDHRYGFIRSVLADGVLRQDPGRDRLALTDKLDRVLTNAFLGPVIMLSVLYFMYQITIEIGAYPQGWVEDGLAALGSWVGDVMEDGPVKSLLVDGIINGVGGVLSFVPLIVIMFSLLSFLEDCGYMARMAYMMDRVFRTFGLHGASVMPYCVAGGIAGGCAIPGAMATRTLRSPKEKLATLLTLPYMTCGAKWPVFLLLATAFFGTDEAPKVMFLLTIVGWIVALLVARALRSTIVKGEPTPFVMELPPYRFPTLFSVLLHCWERAWMYIKKAGTVLLAISVVLWAMMKFPELPEDRAAPLEQKIEEARQAAGSLPAEATDEQRAAAEDVLADAQNALSEEELAYSLAGRLGKAVEPALAPLGYDWRTNIALIAGVAAKEAVVGTLGTAWSLGEIDDPEDEEETKSLGDRLKAAPNWSKATALSLMLFVLLYSPCFVALVVIKQEAGGWKWLFFSMFFNTALAYGVAFLGYRIGQMLWG
ncbi:MULTISPECIES: ferrous iron transport protein B [unclassified Desulfovibrio]|uniref:ferrous iron transport protein B n=1 Tax=unclassified Desulfovibrio TaxID=2593640 RepID=UPI000F5D86DC|nr:MULTISPECIES: ferrous iron transport protein B [unclassified Desulfovibrio]RRD69356.1 ferrous iron transport protein B [Desulfovibrio sp. OH1209_COT-279]RRD86063.1 ferrous iron transport protein B [Desulfovibrio sp. OH1186_COT-070]